VPLLATLPEQMQHMPERHLGLVPPSEVERVDTLLDVLADELQLDEAAWRALAPRPLEPALPAAEPVAPLLAGKTVAIARDAAFCFLYAANLDMLREMGARIVFFSPLLDEPVPGGADIVWLPGGYPELHGAALAGASAWRASIRAAHAAEVAILAECGGLMALAGSITDQDGHTWPMAGLLPGDVIMQTRLGALGSQGLPTPRGLLRGHTFHYSRLDTPLAPAARTVRHPSGAEGEAVYRVGSLTATYFHAFFGSNPQAAVDLLMGATP
jgi:cobyrinic acid a,c-diamide synthase